MGRASRDKGQRGEREVEGIFRSHGLPLLHLAHTGDRFLPVALDGAAGFHVESKRCEAWRVPAWLQQSYDDIGTHHVNAFPLVAFRRSMARPHDPLGTWHAITPLDPLATLLRNAL